MKLYVDNLITSALFTIAGSDYENEYLSKTTDFYLDFNASGIHMSSNYLSFTKKENSYIDKWLLNFTEPILSRHIYP